MSEDARRSWQSRIINGCLAAVVLSAVIPQYWPEMATVSGIAAIASAVVAAAVYFFKPPVEFHERGASKDAPERSGYIRTEGVDNVLKAPLKLDILERAYDLYGEPIKDKEHERLVGRWLVDPKNEQHLEAARRAWVENWEYLQTVKRVNVGSSVYIVTADNKARRKVPRSMRGAMEPAAAPLRSREIH